MASITLPKDILKTALHSENTQQMTSHLNQWQQSHVSSALNQVRVCVEENKSLTELFHQLLDLFGKSIRAYAAEQKFDVAKWYGAKRNEVGVGRVDCTNLHQHGFFEKLMLTAWWCEMRTMNRDEKRFDDIKKEVEDECEGRKSRFDIDIITPKCIQRQKWDIIPSHEELCQTVGSTPQGMPKKASEGEKLKFLAGNKTFMKTLKEKHPELYKRDKMSHALLQLAAEFPSTLMYAASVDGGMVPIKNPANEKSVFIQGTSRLEVNGQLYALSTYLTWLYQDHKNDPLINMVPYSKILIIHQDPFLIEPMLKDIAHVFEQAIRMEKDKIGTDLKGKIGLFLYTFSHAMPFIKGTPEIAALFESIIYAYHDQKHAGNPTIYLSALSSMCFSDFIRTYTLTQEKTLVPK